MRRSVPGWGSPASPRRSAVGAARVAPLEYRNVDPPELPGAGLAPRPHPAVGDLRLRPVDDRGSRLDVLRRRRVVPVRARATRSSASSTTAPGSPSSRCSVMPPGASPLPFDGAAPGDGDDYGHLVAGDARTRHPDRVLLVDRRRLGPRVRRPRQPAAPPRRRARRAGRADRTARRRHPRRPASRPRRVGARRRRTDRRRARRRHDGPGGDRRPRPLRPRASPSSSAPATPTSSARPGGSAPTTSFRPPS